MKKEIFILKNHSKKENDMEVEASLEINQESIEVNYRLTGELENYLFKKPSQQQRANELWRATCFELFIAPKDGLNYWELNISPSKEWNFYAFNDYKEGMREENRISPLNIEMISHKRRLKPSFPSFTKTLKENSQTLSCSFTLGIGGFSPEKSSFNLAVILLDNNGVRHFYSINRKEDGVDFHNRNYWNAF